MQTSLPIGCVFVRISISSLSWRVYKAPVVSSLLVPAFLVPHYVWVKHVQCNLSPVNVGICTSLALGQPCCLPAIKWLMHYNAGLLHYTSGQVRSERLLVPSMLFRSPRGKDRARWDTGIQSHSVLILNIL